MSARRVQRTRLALVWLSLLGAATGLGGCVLEADLISETADDTEPTDSDASTAQDSNSAPCQGEDCENGVFFCSDMEMCDTRCESDSCVTTCERVDDCTSDCLDSVCDDLCMLSSCAQTCTGGGCTLGCQDGDSCSIDCPGNDCTLTCMGTASCEITNCTSGCNVQCIGSDRCENSCGLSQSCTTLDVG